MIHLWSFTSPAERKKMPRLKMLIPTTNHRNSMRRSSCYNRAPYFQIIHPDGILDVFEILRIGTLHGFGGVYIKQRHLWYYRVKYVHIIRLCEGQFPENMVLKGVQYLHISSLNISTKGMDSECQQCKRHVFLPSLFFFQVQVRKG